MSTPIHSNISNIGQVAPTQPLSTQVDVKALSDTAQIQAMNSPQLSPPVENSTSNALLENLSGASMPPHPDAQNLLKLSVAGSCSECLNSTLDEEVEHVQQADGIRGKLNADNPKLLQLQCTPEDDSRFYLPISSAKDVQKDDKFIGYNPATNSISMIIETEDEKHIEVTMNVQEISEKLLISPETLIEHAQKGKLDELFSNKFEKLQKLDKINDTIEQLASDNPSIPRNQLVKISRCFHKNNNYESSKEFTISNINKRGVNKYGFSQSHTILGAKIERDGKLNLLQRDNQKPLGEGAYGSAFKINKLFSQNEFAVKIAHSTEKIAKIRGLDCDNEEDFGKANKMHDRANRELVNEHEILTVVWKDEANVEGVVEPPHSIFELDGNKGYLARLADGDGTKLIETPEMSDKNYNTVKSEYCRQILKGGKLLEKKNVVHADQKLENLFFYKNTDAAGKVSYSVKTADFGGAKISTEPLDHRKIGHTPGAYPSSDLGKATTATGVFQQGVQLYGLLTYGYQNSKGIENYQDAYPRDSKGYMDTSKPFNRQMLVESGVPEKLINIIEKMCMPEARDRLSAAEAFAQWEQAVSK